MSLARDGINMLDQIEIVRRKTCRRMQTTRKAALGQYFTPAPIAQMMAAMMERQGPLVSILDAGAGVGSLFAACVWELCRRPIRPERIQITAYEIDEKLLDYLAETISLCQRECERAGVEFTAEVHPVDFIQSASERVDTNLFGDGAAPEFTCAILNPPYRKIHTNSSHRLWLRRLGVETSNLYTGFLAAAMHLLRPGGEMIAITPRSFCNGPYFKPFRQMLLNTMSLRRLHSYESREEAFRDDVLQENIIIHATKDFPQPEHVLISSSRGPTDARISIRRVSYDEVVRRNDTQSFIHIAPDEQRHLLTKKIAGFACSLSHLGLNVSTGRVVDFRAREWLRSNPEDGTAPLIYPTHLNEGRVTWPEGRTAKPKALVISEQTRSLFVPNEHYVLVKRFSSKEEPKRVVATVFEAGCVPGTIVGFENHLNYFHRQGRGLSLTLAKGLAAFLNSTLVDTYFRQFSGHTQVNATDLRSLTYPTERQLCNLGAKIPRHPMPQDELDDLIASELLDENTILDPSARS